MIRKDFWLTLAFSLIFLSVALVVGHGLDGHFLGGGAETIAMVRDLRAASLISLVLLAVVCVLLVRQHQLHAVARQDGDLLKYALEAASDGLWDWGKGRPTVFSSRWRDLHGVSVAGITPLGPEDWAALAIAEDRPHMLAEWQKFLESDAERYSCDYRVPAASGVSSPDAVRWLRDAGTVVARSADGRPSRIIGTTSDVTLERVADAQNRLSNSVFQNTAEAIVITDPNGAILSVNPAFTQITGFAEEEAIGQTPRILKSDHNSPEFYEGLWRSLLTEGGWQGEIWNRRKDGEAFLAWQTVTAVQDVDGDIMHFVSVFNDITELHVKDQHIRHQAYHDALTGLPNRILLQDRLDHAISLSKREKSQLAVMFIDLDRFKLVNDSLGHAAGDALLVEVARRLKGVMRSSDTFARLGGDEFVIMLSKFAGMPEVAEVAERIVSVVRDPIHIQGHEVQVGASIGISLYPRDGDDVTSLMKGADTAMYRAKAAGRNGYCFFDAHLDGETVERLRLEADLRRAVEKGEFELYYQPKINLVNGDVAGAEALIRWNSPERGLVSPIDFIPLAEENGMISVIGDWVLSEACRQLAAWRDSGLPPVRVAVNVSARQFSDENFVERVEALMEKHALTPDYLEVELTESAVMSDPELTVRQLLKLRDLGVPVSVDDFGTGYSSLSYLKRLPLNTIKIDRSFIRHLDQEGDNAAIVRAILGLGEALGMSAVAEGVETDAEEAHLQEAGCHSAQGYKYSRPLPARSFETWLVAREV